MGSVLHGWLLIAANVAFYAYLCWLGVWFIRGIEGRERVFWVGWFAAILVAPVDALRPEWALTIRYIRVFALAVALLAVLSLLGDPNEKSSAAEQDSCS